VSAAAAIEEAASPTTPTTREPTTVTILQPSPPATTTTTTTTAAPAPGTTRSTDALTDVVVFLTSPGAGDVASQPVLPLGLDVPPVLPVVPNYDTDRDSDPGLTLTRDSDAQREQRFRWEITQEVRLDGPAAVQLHATGAHNRGPFTLDVGLRSCRGSECNDIASRRESTISPGQGFATITFDLGRIDVALTPGDTVELVIGVPPDSASDVWLAYDTTATASRFAFVET
jgi:hypothetical protein